MNKLKLLALPFLLFINWGALAQAADNSRPATPDEIQSITDMLKATLTSVNVSGARISANGKMACGFYNAEKGYIFYAKSFMSERGKPVYNLVAWDATATTKCQEAGINVHR